MTTTDETADPQGQDDAHAVAVWLKELEAARTREKDYRKTGERILHLYDGTKADETPFNILFSNTETLSPALYSAIPRPVVQRRFKDEDPLGKAAAEAGQRVLTFLLDTNVDGYETFDQGMRHVTLNGLLPGRGEAAVVYDADQQELPAEQDGDEPTYTTKSELICLDTKAWNQVSYGYAKKWSKVPWVAYEEEIDEEEAERLFGEDIAGQLVFMESERATGEAGKDGPKEEPSLGERKTCRVYQIWDKDGGRKVRHISEQYPSGYLKVQDDPLQLTGFFNCPRPLQFIEKPHSLTPTALYVIYESQAKELNELTRRIKSVTKAIKARGLYDGALSPDLMKLMDASDCELVPTDTASSLAAEKGLGNAIWFMPIEQLIATLVQLYGAREQCKQVIYEITGISDIVRGASKASETLGAQQIKTQWGTLRLKNKQKEVARYARDLLRIMLELAATKFSEETWAKMTGLPFLLSTKYNELTALAQVLTQQVQLQQQQQAMQAQAMMPQGAPPQPPPPTPQMQQLQQIQAQLQAPQWSQVLALLQDDLQRAYRIDIETNSTVEPEAAEDQQQIQDVLTAIGQVLNGMAPLVANGVMPMQALQVLLLTIVRRYRFGSELEDTIKAMQPPKPQDDGSAAQLQQAQQQLAQMQTQMQQKEASSAMQAQQMQAEQALAAKEQALAHRESKVKHGEDLLQLSMQAAQEKLAMRDQVHAAKVGPDARAIEQMKAKMTQQTEIEKAKIAAAAQIEVARIAAQAKAAQPAPAAVGA